MPYIRFVVSLLLLAVSCSTAAAQNKPNIVLVFLDNFRSGNGTVPLGEGVYGLVQWEVTMALNAFHRV
jgi:hypothetical protein